MRKQQIISTSLRGGTPKQSRNKAASLRTAKQEATEAKRSSTKLIRKDFRLYELYNFRLCRLLQPFGLRNNK
ncbi:MAG: hypothetical protein LBJ17_01310 [Dysgonamonadaceae bacterium]|jgi:hypothetical protein|nr:hypothetical protein [Dysgonamonadaceae bacterium]